MQCSLIQGHDVVTSLCTVPFNYNFIFTRMATQEIFKYPRYVLVWDTSHVARHVAIP